MKYEFIETHRSEFAVIRMCKVLKVFESGFYRWQKRGKSKRETEDDYLVSLIREIFEEGNQVFGPAKIQQKLSDRNVRTSVSRVRRLMRENGLYAISRRKQRPYPKAEEEARFSENLVNQAFSVEKPNEVWVGDITYIRTEAYWVYLAIVLDLFNREVIGYSISRKPNSELTRRAMANALSERNPDGKVIFHSDRGCQYSSRAYQNYLEEHGLSSSMSRTGNPFDNACAESFFATLKKEWVYHRRYRDISHVEGSMFEYIDLFYNRKRPHATLAYKTPKEYYHIHKNRQTT